MDFQERFKGKTDFMKKDGHLGIVIKKSLNPINKQHANEDSYFNQSANPSAQVNSFSLYRNSSYVQDQSKVTRFPTQLSMVQADEGFLNQKNVIQDSLIKHSSSQMIKYNPVIENKISPPFPLENSRNQGMHPPYGPILKHPFQHSSMTQIPQSNLEQGQSFISQHKTFDEGNSDSRFKQNYKGKFAIETTLNHQIQSQQQQNLSAHVSPNLPTQNIKHSASFFNPQRIIVPNIKRDTVNRVQIQNTSMSFSHQPSMSFQVQQPKADLTPVRHPSMKLHLQHDLQSPIIKSSNNQITNRSGHHRQTFSNRPLQPQFKSPDNQVAQYLNKVPQDSSPSEYTQNCDLGSSQNEFARNQQVVHAKKLRNVLSYLVHQNEDDYKDPASPNRISSSNSAIFLQRPGKTKGLGYLEYAQGKVLLPTINANRSFHQSFSESRKQQIVDHIVKNIGYKMRANHPLGYSSPQQ